jgi:Fe-S oxidoreductase
MNPAAMMLLLTCGFGLFAWSMVQRWRLLFAGAERRAQPRPDYRRRWQRLLVDGLLQSRLRQYKVAGLAHTLVFFGFLVLLLRTLTLWGRGFSPGFELPTLGRDAPFDGFIGAAYNEAKDIAAALVLLAVGIFLFQRVVSRPRRLTLSWEGVLILTVIGAMMCADVIYDGASLVLSRIWDLQCAATTQSDCLRITPLVSGVGRHIESNTWRAFPDPLGSLAALGLRGCSTATLRVLGSAGYWTHSVLVLLFLNWLPYSKHFHILTALPNVFLTSTEPGGKLAKVTCDAEALLELADQQQTASGNDQSPLGVARVADLNWKYRLDLLSCTECGRCTDHCPAHDAGQPLDPKQFTLDLRGALYGSQLRRQWPSEVGGSSIPADEDLVPSVIAPETLWACTNCRACEEQCPVGISYVDKIVDFRRDLVLMRGELPNELQRAFDGIEHAGNPWGLPRSERATWAADLGIKRIADVEQTDVLFWVGCAASYDQRAQRVARSLVSLRREAKIDFAILGEEENCTGDAARRAGNEYLFLKMAQSNIEVLNGYYEAHRFRRIVTACPHCLSTLKHEYPDFGGMWPIVHHQQLLLELVQQGRLQPNKRFEKTAVFHDPCTLARYASDVVSPRELLRRVEGLSLREATRHGRFTRCCGAGGARMWMDDAPGTRMNTVRTKELQRTGADTIVTACPFCTTMIDDGVASVGDVRPAPVLDIAEVLAEACGITN